MASTLPPVKGTAFSFEIALVSQGDTDIFQTSVTLEATDVQVSKDGGAFNNIASLPTEIGTSGVLIVALSIDEMNADRVAVRFHDSAGDEWQDALVTIYTGAQTLNAIATTIGVAGAGLTAVAPIVWAEPLPGAYAAGTAGNILGNIVASLTVALTASAAFLAAIANAVWTWGTRTLTSLATALVGRAQEWLAANLSMEFCQGETKTVQLVITTQAGGVWDITNYTVVWVLSATRGGAALITKTTADGSIVLNDPTHGGAVFTLTSTETNALAAQTYWHESHIKSPGGVESCVLHGRCTVTESTIGAI